jgi:hypothetical protein
MSNNDWNPVNDVWDSYNAKLDSYKDMMPYSDFDAEEMHNALWPEDLYLGDEELEDAKEFVAKRTMEVLTMIRRFNGLHPDMIYSYIMKSLISGMLWEKERIG